MAIAYVGHIRKPILRIHVPYAVEDDPLNVLIIVGRMGLGSIPNSV